MKKWSELSESEQYNAAREAESIGGSFARLIAGAWFVADSRNKAKLDAAFGDDLLAKYAAMGSGK